MRNYILVLVMLIGLMPCSAQEVINDSTTFKTSKKGGPIVTKTVGEGNDKVIELTDKGLDLAGKGKYKKALVKLYKALELDPNNPELLSNVGSIENRNGNSIKAEEYLERAWVASGRTNLDVAVNLGLACYYNMKYAKSVGYFTQVISGSNDLTTQGAAYYNRCMAYSKSGKCQEAEADYLSVKKLYLGIRSAAASINQLKGMVMRCK